jgi:hypothetical protein
MDVIERNIEISAFILGSDVKLLKINNFWRHCEN